MSGIQVWLPLTGASNSWSLINFYSKWVEEQVLVDMLKGVVPEEYTMLPGYICQSLHHQLEHFQELAIENQKEESNSRS